jgi:very-short-patch-repair endonuclease
MSDMPRRNATQADALARALAVAAHQAMVCTREQALAVGITDRTIRRELGADRWLRLHQGVYLLGRGEPGLDARLWAGHLAAGHDSVLAGRSAGALWGVDELPPQAQVALMRPEQQRSRVPGIEVRRIRHLDVWTHPARRPPVLTIEHTVIDLVELARTDAAAIEYVMRACRERRTTPKRILDAARSHPRLTRRPLLSAVCAEVRAGVASPLERLYRNRVERAHGLPVGARQSPELIGEQRIYRDVAYRRHHLIVELDGRRGHEDALSGMRDQLRDNAARLAGHMTLRFGWLAVAGHACRTADQVAAGLRVGGWTGQPVRCGPDCRLEAGTTRAA